MGMNLFEGSDGSDDDIQINNEFARRYEHNKMREGLQRLEELKKKGLVNDSSSNSGDSSSSEDGYFEEIMKDLNNQKKNEQFFNALVKVKDQDPDFNSREFKLFESDSESESRDGSAGEATRKKEKKPKYLKDVMATHLMEAGPEFEDKLGTRLPVGLKSYSQEQEELRKAVLDAADQAFAEEEDDDGEFLKVKESGRSVEDDAEIGKKADEFFGEDEKLDQESMYLKKYFTKKMWVGMGENNDAEGTAGFSEDEEEVERQENYERGYNFRFEENAGDRVMGHSRFVEGSVRKKMSARQLQRKSKEERMALTEFERKEELKHLKNLKKKEMNEKLRKIREIAGIKTEEFCALDVDYLEEDFDPNEYDRKMKQAFDDGYYQAVDVDPRYESDNDDCDLEKPDFDKENELLGLPKGWDKIYGSGDGFLATRERNLKRGVDDGSSQEEVEGKEGRASEEGKSKKKRIKPSPEEAKLRQELLDEYYKLDYEDTVGDLKTRFKYKSVDPNKYGLNAEEVLLMDDMELNQYVSLKKLAPYREKEWKVPRIKTHNQKQRNKALIQRETTEGQKTDKKFRSGLKSTREVAAVSEDKLQPSDTHAEPSNLSRKSRRKHRQSELKLSRSRLMAYGKIQSKSKKKK